MLNGLDLFSGIGGLSLALSEWVEPIAYCELDPYCQSVLLSQMQRGNLKYAPIWDDVRTLCREHIDVPVDIIYGGFPCQPYSTAARGRNKKDTCLSDFIRLITELRPKIVFAENTTLSAIEKFCQECEAMGYTTKKLANEASNVGAPFIGRRYWAIAAPNREGKSIVPVDDEVAVIQATQQTFWKSVDAKSLRMADGIPYRMDRLRALGNSVVPLQAREAFKKLIGLGD